MPRARALRGVSGLEELAKRLEAVRHRLLAGDAPAQVLGLLFATVTPRLLVTASQDLDEAPVCDDVRREVRRAFGQDVDVTFHGPQHLAAHELTHGTFDVAHRRGIFIYAPDADVGVLQVGVGPRAIEGRFGRGAVAP